MAVKRLSLLLAILILLAMLGGCWSRHEIEDVAILSAIGWDHIETSDGRDKYRTSQLVIRPGQISGESQQGIGMERKLSWLLTGIGDTIQDAARNNMSRSPRIKLHGHANPIIIGERMARADLNEVVDYILRDSRPRLRSWALIAKGEAMEILRAEPEMEKFLAEEIKGKMNISVPLMSKMPMITFKDFLLQLSTPGWDPVITGIEVYNPPEIMDDNTNEGEKTKTVRLSGGAVFRQNTLAGWMEDTDVMGYLYVIGEAKRGMITIESPMNRDKQVTIAMFNSNSTINPVARDGRITVYIDISASGDIRLDNDPQPIAEPEVVDMLEQELSRKIKRMAENSIRLAQKEFRADIFSFGYRLHKSNPNVWHEIQDDWYDIYPTVETVVNVNAKIRRTGMINNHPVIK